MASHIDHALKAAEALGGVADLHTWIGVLGPFGDWLGWPSWYFEGTEIDIRHGVPPTTSYRDGLIINANILEHGMSAELINRTLDCKRLVTGPDAALIVRNAPTLGEASRSLVALLSLTNPCVKLRRSIELNDVKIRIVEQIDTGKILGFYSAIRVILFSRMIQQFLIDDLNEVRISLTLSKSEAGSKLETALGAKVEFGAKYNSMIYPARWEQRRNFDYELSLWRVALTQLESLEKRLDTPDYPHKLRHYLATMIESENRVPRLKEIAAHENLSVRTLNRSLSDAGVRYRDIVDDVRLSLISKLLANPTLTLQEIARDTGYSNVSGFSRAFKRWFGECPAQYRGRLQQRP